MKSPLHIVSIALLFLFQGLPCYGQDFVWARSLVGRGQSNPQNLSEGASHCAGLVTDEDNFVYITGVCNDSVDFDPGPNEDFVAAGQEDVYIAKYSPQGELVWRHVLISQGGNDVEHITQDVNGDLLIIGSVQSSVDFDPSTGTAMVSPDGNANLMFIAKYTSDGDFVWVKAIGAQYATWGVDLETDANGAIYITGSFYNQLDADPGNDVQLLTSNGLAIFFAKYSENGDLVWAKHIPNCSNLSGASDIDLSADGDIFIAGFFGNAPDFDPGAGTHTLTANSVDRYFAKYTNDGDFVWANSIDVNEGQVLSNSRSVELAIDSEENVILTGNFKSAVDFDPGPDIVQLISTTGGYSNFLCKYDANGEILWAKMLMGSFCVAFDIGLDCAENIVLTGCFTQADFDTGPETYNYTTNVQSAFMNFFAQYDKDGNFDWVRRIGNNGYGSGIIKSELYLNNGFQYVFGAFKQTGDFNPDETDEHKLTMGGVGWNSFFGKYAGNWTDDSNAITTCDYNQPVLNGDTSADHFLWQDGSTQPSFTVTEPGTYWVVQSTGTCSKTTTFEVIFEECGNTVFEMPNVFTPNSDGSNDVFLPVKNYNITNYELLILNRYGNQVFQSTDKNFGWNGMSGNKDCSEGTYYWIVKYTDHENREHQQHGFLQLVR